MRLKFITGLLSGFAFLTFSTNDAKALYISDQQTIGVTLDLDATTPAPSTYSGLFDLTGYGVPSSLTVYSGNVSFTLLNMDGMQEFVTASLEGDILLGASSQLGFSAFGGSISGSVVSSLNSNGLLNYSVSYFGGTPTYSSVILSQAALIAEVGSNAQISVPDGGATITLLGLGMLGLGWLGRRQRIA